MSLDRLAVGCIALGWLSLAGCGARTTVDDADDLGVGGAAGHGAHTSTGATGATGGATTTTTSSGSGAGAGTGGSMADIRDQLEDIVGAANVDEEPSEIPGYRFFVLWFEQPEDHDAPDGDSFPQRLALHHRGADRPVVLDSTGYGLWLPTQYLEEPASLLGANQIAVEHRFFSPSRPEPPDWSRLTVEQAAADHHRIVEAFRAIYPAAWVSTGASKGGMTSVYHRRFYPDDVDGTVAYVAPHSQGPDDERYLAFLDSVGEPSCRQALHTFERELLLRRSAMLARMVAQAENLGIRYDLVGVEPTFESTVCSFSFGFWQYYGADRCGDVPAASASDDTLWAFFDEIGSPWWSSDEWVLFFEPYYWQAETELGYPATDLSHLADLLVFDPAQVDWMPSIAQAPVFDPTAMEDIGSWVATEGRQLLFIYGETDPWTAGAFELGQSVDSYRLVAPGQNHGAQIAGLNGADQALALDVLEAWTGVTPSWYRSAGTPTVDGAALRRQRQLRPLPARR